jgi:hypothetical protein
MIVAGIDIGNSTTEVVLARIEEDRILPLQVARARTSGEKGSRESMEGAVRILERAERLSECTAEIIALAELHPVRTLVAEFPRVPAYSAPLRALTGGGTTTLSGEGLVWGTHLPISALGNEPGSEPIVVSVPRGVDFEDAARVIGAALAQGRKIVGCVLAADEAVLVGNRLPVSMPIVDEVDVELLEVGAKIALEVTRHGESINGLNDPVRLVAIFGLSTSEVAALAPLARSLSDAHAAVVSTGLVVNTDAVIDQGRLEFEWEGKTGTLPLSGDCRSLLSVLVPGSVRSLYPPRESDLAEAVRGCEQFVRDICVADLPALRECSSVRRGSAYLDSAPVSIYIASGGPVDPERVIGAAAQRPVWIAAEESEAARLGALTTPGTPSNATVCDIGGGTVDVVGDGGAVVAAGAGELLTTSVAFALGLPRGLAEYVKRGASVRVEAPHVVRQEDGLRSFLDAPAKGPAVGKLCIKRGSGMVPFNDTLSPEEWRALRLSIKARVIAANIERCLGTLPDRPEVLLLCGGAAEDRELVRIVGDWIGATGTAVGRTNVAGRYGPRYAVALGLVAMLSKRKQGSGVSLACSIRPEELMGG